MANKTRISLRLDGKLLALKIEDANLANIDRVAMARNMSRSEWMREALLVQLACDLADVAESQKAVDEFVNVLANHKIELPALKVQADTRPNRWR